MFERECKVFAFLLDYGQKLAADIDDARFTDQPSAGINHPAWLFGHLAIATDFASQLLGEPGTLPRSWFRDFTTGSTPRTDRKSYPSKAELLTAWETGHGRVDRAVRVAPAGSLDEPHSFEIPVLKLFFPTAVASSRGARGETLRERLADGRGGRPSSGRIP